MKKLQNPFMTEGPPPAWLKIVASLFGMIKGGNANVQFIPILWVQWRIDIPFLSHSQIKIARSHPGSSSIWFLIIGTIWEGASPTAIAF
jgi:hypothetical protein